MPSISDRAISIVHPGQLIEKGVYLYHLSDEVRTAMSVGGGSESVRCSRVAAETMSAWTCVRCNVNGLLVRCESGDDTQQDLMLGLLTHAVSVGDTGLVLQQGVVTDSAFSRFAVEDLLFVAADATLTNIPVDTGFLQMVGRVIAEHTLSIDCSQAILRIR